MDHLYTGIKSPAPYQDILCISFCVIVFTIALRAAQIYELKLKEIHSKLWGYVIQYDEECYIKFQGDPVTHYAYRQSTFQAF